MGINLNNTKLLKSIGQIPSLGSRETCSELAIYSLSNAKLAKQS